MNKLYTHELTRKNIVDICSLKSQFWKYSLDEQMTWFNKYVTNNNIHYLYFSDNALVGYACIRNIDEDFCVLDPLIIDESHRGKHIGSKILNFIKKHDNKNILLISTKQTANFYLKNDFHETNNINFYDKKILENHLIFIQFPVNKKININYYS